MRRTIWLVLLALFACDDGGTPEDAVEDSVVLDAATDATADAGLDTDSAPPDATAPDAAPVEPARVLVNELGCRDRWIELTNVGGADADLADYVVRDPRRRSDRRVRLEGALPAGAFARVTLPFDLYCGDMALTLIGPDGVSDPLSAPIRPAAYTFGRLPDATGEWTETAPTPGAPNQAYAVPGQAFFDDSVHRIELTLARLAIGDDTDADADAMIQIDDGPVQPMGVSSSGRNGRAQRIDQKPTLDIVLRTPLDGITGFTLDAALLDPAFLTAPLAGEMMRAAGLPAQRTGFAWVVINGEDYGLYVITEAFDAQYLERHFISTWHLYASTNLEYRESQEFRFDPIVGAPFERADIVGLVGFFEVPEGESYFANTTDFIDWPQVTRQMAADIYLGGKDGYAVSRGEARSHFDRLGRLRQLPIGLDFALREPVAWHNGLGELLRRCMSDAACRPLYDAQLTEVVAAVHQTDWVARLGVLRDTLRPWVEMDPRRLSSLVAFDADVATIEGFLVDRRVEADALVQCLATDPDADGDLRRCDEDCDPTDPDTHVGAREVCGDDVDQDCTGVLDDGICPDCQPVQRGARTYLVCPRNRWWGAARQLCQQLGADLVTLETRGEARWLTTEAHAIQRQEYWLGYSDQEEEGVLAWVDGVERAVDWPWNDGEPNDSGGEEDCAHIRTDGRWNDANCDTAKGILCALPCEDVDADGDGYSGCGFDCDDTDPAINPDAIDTCGDGIDQDCNGQIDDDDCACVTKLRDGRRYLFCPDGRSFDDARALCQAEGADLIIVDDQAENDWAYEQARRVQYQRWWVGLSDQADEGFYRWWDGRRPDFTAYSRGEPNDSGHVEDCLHFWENRAQWNDIGCGAQQGAICEDVD